MGAWEVKLWWEFDFHVEIDRSLAWGHTASRPHRRGDMEQKVRGEWRIEMLWEDTLHISNSHTQALRQ